MKRRLRKIPLDVSMAAILRDIEHLSLPRVFQFKRSATGSRHERESSFAICQSLISHRPPLASVNYSRRGGAEVRPRGRFLGGNVMARRSRAEPANLRGFPEYSRRRGAPIAARRHDWPVLKRTRHGSVLVRPGAPRKHRASARERSVYRAYTRRGLASSRDVDRIANPGESW